MLFGLGVIPYLIQWIAFSQFGTYQLPLPQSIPRNQWTLLTDFHQFKDFNVEQILPQVCELLLERDSSPENAVFEYFESIMIEKCANCLPLGIKMCSLLQASCVVYVAWMFRLPRS